jgi:hypothetical protein
MALFDTGASSCSISREVLRQVEKVVPVARAEANHNFTLQGVIPGITIPVTEIVYLPIALQNGHVIHSVPMVVIDHGTDLIIGANMVRTYKWASYWEEGKYFIDVGKDLTPVPARFQPSSELTGVSINCVQLQPKESKIIDLEIPSLKGLRETSFHRLNLQVESPEGVDSKSGFYVVPSVSKLRHGRLHAMIHNGTDYPVYLDEPSVLAKVSVIPGSVENNTNIIDITSFRQKSAIFDQIPRAEHGICHCEVAEDDSHIIVQLADKYVYTNTNL